MRDEKEERKKQARSNKQTRQSNTAHPRQSLFRAASGGTRTHDTLYSRQSALPTELPRQLSWLGPNLTSHSTPDEQANHQLSMKEKAGVTCTCTWLLPSFFLISHLKTCTCTLCLCTVPPSVCTWKCTP